VDGRLGKWGTTWTRDKAGAVRVDWWETLDGRVDIREWGFGGISLWVGELDVFCGKRIESCGEWLVLVGIEVSGVVGETKEKREDIFFKNNISWDVDTISDWIETPISFVTHTVT